MAVVLAGGTGSRVGGSVPKQFLELAGRTVLEHTVAALHACDGVSELLVVVHADHLERARQLLSGRDLPKLTRLLPGGKDRMASTRCALDALGEQECNVLLHDAARPLVSPRVVQDCIEALKRCGAVAVATPAVDTLLRVDDEGRVVDVPDRRSLRHAQTPQGFKLSVIRQAHARAEQVGDTRATDDCSLVVRHLPEVAVHVVPGQPDNLKLTHPSDHLVLQALLDARAAQG